MQLHRAEPRFREKGASLQLVGIGAPAVIRAFREETGVSAPIFADPTFATYRALGMRRGIGTYLSLSFVRNAIRAMRAGYRNRSIEGDAMQHGGVLVVRPGDEVAYRFTSRTAGDHPPVDEILGAL